LKNSTKLYLFHSAGVPEPYIKGLEKIFPGLKRIALTPSGNVYESISSHPDIFIFSLDCESFVFSRSLDKNIVGGLKKTGARFFESVSIPRGLYPDTAPINAVRVGDFVFHNLKITDASIKRLAHERALGLVHVNQGYARCSVIPVGDKALITSDEMIAKEARKKGLEAELVSCEGVTLPGEKRGFIGGAAGLTPDGTVIFLGDVERHPDFTKIENFLKKYKTPYRYLANLDLFDAGGLFFIKKSCPTSTR